MIKTFVVMLSTDSDLTPSILAEKIALVSGVEYKETCYGLLLEGEEAALEKALAELRKLDPNRIFYKVRGYRIGDKRICRAKRGGGPRPGYHMLSMEREVLKNVSKALEAGEGGAVEGLGKEKGAGDEEEAAERERKKQAIDVSLLKKIIGEEEKGEGTGAEKEEKKERGSGGSRD